MFDLTAESLFSQIRQNDPWDILVQLCGIYRCKRKIIYSGL